MEELVNPSTTGDLLKVGKDTVLELQSSLLDSSLPIARRFRSLFTLRGIGGKDAIDALARAFSDSSALLRHEVAYCLGQMGDPYAFPILANILKNTSEHPMVRHEAAEAIGAIGHQEAIKLLKEFSADMIREVAETCQLAVKRIEWYSIHHDMVTQDNGENFPRAYLSIDPAPPLSPAPLNELKEHFLDPQGHIFDRYRALFALRDLGTEEAVKVLIEAFGDSSALLRHEVAFVLGQLQHPTAVPALIRVLEDSSESAMVRHEAAEALGAIASQDALPLLNYYIKDPEPIVCESCLVALDVHEYFSNENEFQYADGLKLLLEKSFYQTWSDHL
jgi:deoxyhypusine monooxygenase